MVFPYAQIIIWEGLAYVPSKARYPNGIFTSIDPIHIARPILSELVPIVEEILIKEPPLLPDPTREEVKAQRDLLPRVTGARSWKRLCEKGVSYTIDESSKGIILDMSRLDQKGRWEFDPEKCQIYPPGTDLALIIQAVLDDLSIRSQINNGALAEDQGAV